MKTYMVQIDDVSAEFYQNVAQLCNTSTEDILEETFLKVVDMIGITVLNQNGDVQ